MADCGATVHFRSQGLAVKGASEVYQQELVVVSMVTCNTTSRFSEISCLVALFVRRFLNVRGIVSV